VHIENESSIIFSKKAQSRRRARRSLDDEVNKTLANLKSPLLELNKCPDLIVDRGHYFGTSYFAEEPPLSDDDKRALMNFLSLFNEAISLVDIPSCSSL